MEWTDERIARELRVCDEIITGSAEEKYWAWTNYHTALVALKQERALRRRAEGEQVAVWGQVVQVLDWARRFFLAMTENRPTDELIDEGKRLGLDLSDSS